MKKKITNEEFKKILLETSKVASNNGFKLRNYIERQYLINYHNEEYNIIVSIYASTGTVTIVFQGESKYFKKTTLNKMLDILKNPLYYI